MVGFCVLGTALAIRVALGHVTVQLPDVWWMYLGGPLGLMSIGLMAILVRGLGLLMLGVASTAGQLLGSVLIDVLIPSLGNSVCRNHEKRRFSAYPEPAPRTAERGSACVSRAAPAVPSP
ncbi:DMT family transporter [Escherichia coli]|nr:DMT family transporter [Escherichia coli]EJS7133619.1 DMT family transporter [Escherichia coli]